MAIAKSAYAGYEKTAEVTILRTKHTVRFRIGDRVEEVGELLNRIPCMAQVDEVLEPSPENNDLAIIVFHHEKLLRSEETIR